MTWVRLLAVVFCSLLSLKYCHASSDQPNSAVIGSKKCLLSANWCKNITTAVECNAFKYCLDTVWLTQKMPSSSLGGDLCQTCESTIDSIRNSVDSNTSKEVLQNALEYICELTIVTRLIRKKCEKYVDGYVDEYLNQLLDLFKSDVDSAQICYILNLCASSQLSLVESSSSSDEDVVIYFRNIVLHLPAKFVNVEETEGLLGSERCTWGPSYWCHNLSSSSECKSTSHCIESVWQHTNYEEDNDNVCQICKDMVKQARDQLQSNETQEELREVFEGSCKLIPIKEVQKECIKLADEFVPELTEMLVSQMNPTAICTVAGLCNSPRIDKLLEFAGMPPMFDQRLQDCISCTAGVTAIEQYLNTTPANEVLQKLMGFCGELSSYSDICTNLLSENFDKIYAMLKREARPFPVCHFNGMCAYRYHLHGSEVDKTIEAKANALLTSGDDDLPCDLCKQLVTHFKQILVTNTTEEEFLATLKGICEQTGKFREECLNVVENNFEYIYKFLTEEVQPDVLCKDANLCPKSHNYVSDEGMNLIETVSLQPAAVVQIVPKDTECSFCKMIVKQVELELKNPEFKKDIEKAVKEVCYLLPQKDRAKCDKFIDEYADELIQLLTEEADPDDVCALLGLCANSKQPHDKPLCELCQNILHEIQEGLEDPSTEKSIQHTVSQVCSLLPKSIEDQCHEFINQYSSLIVSVLAEEVDPSLVCPAIKVCPSFLRPETRCGHCQNLIGDIVHNLGGKRNIPGIRSQLKGLVASAKSANLTAVAAELKANHQEDIVDMLTAEFSVNESCVFLHFCTPSMVAIPTKNEVKLEAENDEYENEVAQTIETSGLPSCELCELMVKIYEKKFVSKATVKEVEEELLKYCNRLHNPEARANCTQFVDKYVPLVMNLLEKDVKPKQVCGLMKLCSMQAPNTYSIETSQKCSLCEVVVGSLKSLIQDPYVLQALVKDQSKICELISPKGKLVCEGIVKQILPQLDNTAMDIPSWFYCSKIDMCPYKEQLNVPRPLA